MNHAEIAARVREHCNKGLGENCACANKIANGEVGLEEALSFLHSLLASDNRYTVVIDGGQNLMGLFGFGFILDVLGGDDMGVPLNMSGIDPFDGVEEAEVVEESSGGTKSQPNSAVSPRRRETLALNVSLFRQDRLPGKGEDAHITGFRRDRERGGKGHWGGSKNFRGGKGGN